MYRWKEDIYLQHKLKNWLYRHFKDNFLVYFTIIVFLIIGIIIGAVSIRILDSDQKGQVISFFNSFFKLISNDEVDSFLLLKESILNNLKTIFLIWITGIIIIGIPIIPIIILLRGFAIGFTVGFLVNEFGIKGLLFALFSILPQNLFVIPGIISISSIGMVNSLNSIRRKRLQSTYNHKLTNFINYSVIIFIFSIIIMIGSLVEAYITPIFMRLITDYIYWSKYNNYLKDFKRLCWIYRL